MTRIGQQRLHALVYGTVLAAQGLREYQEVVAAARAVFAGKVEWSRELQELHRALKDGGFVE